MLRWIGPALIAVGLLLNGLAYPLAERIQNWIDWRESRRRARTRPGA